MEFVDGIYPHPPWRMHGEAYFAPVLVDTRAAVLPNGFEFVHPGRYTIGTVGLVRYRAPSPLVYDELIFMPGYVRAKDFGPRAKGWFVSVMYVSETHTLRGGREIWKLPKTLATFTDTARGVRVVADDGTKLELEVGKRGPTIAGRGKISTLQYNDGISLCRFTGDARASFGAAKFRVESFETPAPAWGGFDPSRRLPLPAMTQQQFVSDMQVPTFVRRAG